MPHNQTHNSPFSQLSDAARQTLAAWSAYKPLKCALPPPATSAMSTAA